MEHPYRWAAAVGAAIAAAAWAASRARQHRNPDWPVLPPATPPRELPRPDAPRDGRPPDQPPPRPATPPAVEPPKVVPMPTNRNAEASERLAAATALAATLTQPVRATDTHIQKLTGELAAEVGKLGRPGEDAAATALRIFRQLDVEAQRRWPSSNLAGRAGEIAWNAVFFAADGSGLAPWTQSRQTRVITNELMGTDELLLRTAVAHAVIRPEAANPFAHAIALWRRGVVPDLAADAVVVRRGGNVVARSVTAVEGPDAGRGVA